MTSLGKLLLVAALTEDALLLKDKHGVLQLFVTTGADKVLRVPGATHGCGKGSSGGREGGRERGREGSDNLTSNAFIAHHSIHITANSPNCTKCARSQLFLSLSTASVSTLYCTLCVYTFMLQQHFSLSSPDGLGAGGTDSLSLGEFGSH